MLVIPSDRRAVSFVQHLIIPKLSHQPQKKCYPFTRSTSVVILGGSSGVGLQTAKYLRAKGVTVRSFSRRTGYDLNSSTNAVAALQQAHEGVAVCIGAGARPSLVSDELKLYTNVIKALNETKDAGLVVTVVRSLVLTEVQQLLSSALRGPWVILRPGAMVGRPECTDSPGSNFQERLLVTSDLRCNGLVSRQSVGRVVGDLLLGALAIEDINNIILGVYDEERMVSHPHGCKFVGVGLWRCPTE